MTPPVEAFRAPLYDGVAPATADVVYLVVEAVRGARGRRARVQVGRRPDRGRSLTPRPADEQAVAPSHAGSPSCSPAVRPGSSDGSSSGSPKRGLRPCRSPGANRRRSLRSSGTTAGPTAAQPSAWASSKRRDQSGAGTAPATRCATASASSRRGAPPAPPAPRVCAHPGPRRSRRRGAARRCAERRRRRRSRAYDADRRKPEPVLLDEVERQSVPPRGHGRARTGAASSTRSPGSTGCGSAVRMPIPHDRIPQ